MEEKEENLKRKTEDLQLLIEKYKKKLDEVRSDCSCKKYNSKKPKRGKKLKCFSRVDSKNKRYVTCIKMKTKGTRGGKLPLSYFGAPIHKNFSKSRNMCFHL